MNNEWIQFSKRRRRKTKKNIFGCWTEMDNTIIWPKSCGRRLATGVFIWWCIFFCFSNYYFQYGLWIIFEYKYRFFVWTIGLAIMVIWNLFIFFSSPLICWIERWKQKAILTEMILSFLFCNCHSKSFFIWKFWAMARFKYLPNQVKQSKILSTHHDCNVLNIILFWFLFFSQTVKIVTF